MIYEVLTMIIGTLWSFNSFNIRSYTAPFLHYQRVDLQNVNPPGRPWEPPCCRRPTGTLGMAFPRESFSPAMFDYLRVRSFLKHWMGLGKRSAGRLILHIFGCQSQVHCVGLLILRFQTWHFLVGFSAVVAVKPWVTPFRMAKSLWLKRFCYFWYWPSELLGTQSELAINIPPVLFQGSSCAAFCRCSSVWASCPWMCRLSLTGVPGVADEVLFSHVFTAPGFYPSASSRSTYWLIYGWQPDPRSSPCTGEPG